MESDLKQIQAHIAACDYTQAYSLASQAYQDSQELPTKLHYLQLYAEAVAWLCDLYKMSTQVAPLVDRHLQEVENIPLKC